MANKGEITIKYTIVYSKAGNPQTNSNGLHYTKYVDILGTDASTLSSPKSGTDDTRYIRTRINTNWNQIDMAGYNDALGATKDDPGKSDLNIGGYFADSGDSEYAIELKINNQNETITQTTRPTNTKDITGTTSTFEGIGSGVNPANLYMVAFNDGDYRINYSVKNISVSVAAPEPKLTLDKTSENVERGSSVTITPKLEAVTSPETEIKNIVWSKEGNGTDKINGNMDNETGKYTITVDDNADIGSYATFKATYTAAGNKVTSAECTVTVVSVYGYSIDMDGRKTMYAGSQSATISNGAEFVDAEGFTDLNGNKFKRFDNFNLNSNKKAQLTFPDIDLADSSYDTVGVCLAVPKSSKVSLSVSVGNTQITEEKVDVSTDESEWTTYELVDLPITDPSGLSGAVTLDITGTGTYAGNYLYIRFYNKANVVGEYPGVTGNFDGKGTHQTDSNQYEIMPNVDPVAKRAFTREEIKYVDSKYTENYLNYIGKSNGVLPKITNLILDKGTYNIYYLGNNHGKAVQVTLNDGNGGSQIIMATNQGVEFAKAGGTTLKLYTMPLVLTEDLTGGSLEFNDETENSYLPDLYSVLIVKMDDVGFGDSGTDSGYYYKGNDANTTKYGIIRYLQEYVGTGNVTEYGFYFINSNGLIQDQEKHIVNGESVENGFYGDLTEIAEGNFDETYYAVGYIVVDGVTYFADSIGGKVNSEAATAKWVKDPDTDQE